MFETRAARIYKRITDGFSLSIPPYRYRRVSYYPFRPTYQIPYGGAFPPPVRTEIGPRGMVDGA